MFEFVIRFFLCNLFLTGFIGILFGIRHLFRRHISARIQFHLWFLMLGLMGVPFLPFHLPRLSEVFQFAHTFINIAQNGALTVGRLDPSMSQTVSAGWADNFTISVSRGTPCTLSLFLCGIWILGTLTMGILFLRSRQRLRSVKRSALPLQNRQVYALFRECTAALDITGHISVYSTAFLKTPITTGLFHPQIYIPIHLISDHSEKDMRYILLHELQHCRHRDAVPNFFMSLAGILYWFNPAVWFALREMRTDREVACDCAVLQCLTEKDYKDYGNTLINFAEKISFLPFPFASGLGGTGKQIKTRILNIVSYRPLSLRQKRKGLFLYGLIVLLTLTYAPLLSAYAAQQEYYDFQTAEKNVSYIDLSSCFDDYKGSFVLYDTADDRWTIYNKELASLRVSPDSTYKIYEGLMGLETGVISLDDSRISWDGTIWPFDSWNADQNLNTAMCNSVNWYFEKMGASIGRSTVQNYLNQLHYGNANMSGETGYWMESSLKISPIEQVELLKKLNTSQLPMNQENITAIKDSICISSDSEQAFYGKTGTGRVNGQDVNGWFIGFLEKSGNVFYFAANIQGESDAAGSRAADITASVLSHIYPEQISWQSMCKN